MQKSSKQTAYIVNHTHWDREWRYSIWETRFMLVEFIDELITLLERGDCASFLMDGQVSPILDYLQIRPEMGDRVKVLVASGKLEIGPWYTLPDEFPVDGEALVRNLLWGIRHSRQLGGELKVGYTSFGWGQTAQLPQIYSGFGMDTAFMGKRVDKSRAPKSEFLWKAPDGSTLLASRFGVWGRQNFYFLVNLTSLFGIDHLGNDWHSQWDKEKMLFHGADDDVVEQDYFRLEEPSTFHPEIIDADRADQTWQTTDDSVIPDDRLMMNGCDYGAATPFLPKMVERLNDVDASRGRVWKQSTLTDFVKVMKEKTTGVDLSVVQGELRDGPSAMITGNALMTRNYLKFLNKKAQNLLIRYAEPLSVLAAINGAEYPRKMLDMAWENLLQSHAHDSINGVTQDDTADDTASRLKTAARLSRAIGTQAIQQIVKQADMSGFKPEDVLLTVFNPAPYPRREIMTAWVDVPFDVEAYPLMMPSADRLILADAEGKAVPTQWMESHIQKAAIQQNHTRAFPLIVKRHRVTFDTGLLPAGGYKVFKVDRDDTADKNSIEWADQITRTSDLLKSATVMENEFLRVSVNPNGTFDLTDKESGRCYRNLNYYEDRGDHGNYWIYEGPHKDQVFSSQAANARIWASVRGPLMATIVAEVTLEIPSQGDFENRSRGRDRTPLTITTSMTLKADSRQVEIQVEFENRQKDHSLRAMLPTGLVKATDAIVGGHFNVQSRPIRPQGPDKTAYWPDMLTLPFDGFVDVSDGQRGLAVVNDCLTEYEVSDNEQRILALTLLRSMRNGICTELRVWSNYPSQDGGQCMGKHTVHYAVCPHAGTWSDAQLDLKAALFNTPLRSVLTNRHKGTIQGPAVSLFSLSNTVVRCSALKQAEQSDGYIVRLYNPTDATEQTTAVFGRPVKNAWLTNLNEERQSPLAVGDDGTIVVSLPQKKIVTIELEFKKERK